jgi:hypothetical protein
MSELVYVAGVLHLIPICVECSNLFVRFASMTPSAFGVLTVPQLKDLLKGHGLRTTGLKAELVQRLLAHHQATHPALHQDTPVLPASAANVAAALAGAPPPTTTCYCGLAFDDHTEKVPALFCCQSVPMCACMSVCAS